MTFDIMQPEECIKYFESIDSDVFIYMGPIDRSGYNQFTELVKKADKRKNLLLVLGTYGGDPHAGYRIARAAIHHYGEKNFNILIPGFCKSAGTLICIGASKLIMLDKSELGPLDVQIPKRDEIFQLSSGLDIIRGMSYLQMEALQAFNAYLMEINGAGGLSTAVASDISSKLVTGLYEPLFAQIDPVKLGEMSAALQIANEYGTRLNQKSKALKPTALQRLIHEYPAHGFVIDRSEARTLFEQVEKPDEKTEELARFVYTTFPVGGSGGKAAVLDLEQLARHFLKDKINDDQPGLSESSDGKAGESPSSQPGDAEPESVGQPPGEHATEQPSVRDEQTHAGTDQGTAPISESVPRRRRRKNNQ